jgi:hypothetical protein
VSTRPVHPRRTVPLDHLERLQAAAEVLADMAEAAPGPPELVGLVDLASFGLDPGPGERPDTLTLTTLAGPDPVGQLLGLTGLDEWWAVGIVSNGNARPLDGGPRRWPVTFVHLVARDGTSLDLLDEGDGLRRTTGPDPEMRTGRVPDLCRRVLGLPTGPPPCGLGPHLVDLWLGDLVRAALDRPSLSWSEAAALHPVVGFVGLPALTPSPAELIRATAEIADPLHWETYRAACEAAGRAPLDHIPADAVGWFDAGSFARWLLDEAAPQALLLEHLDAVLPRATADRVFATVQLSPRPPWPSRSAT